ncbi:MAG TPA: AbrB/MazE/SpoVT family DNA-binding domain-containing protein [Opitutus sp.]|nr:AbrB/MazE/SpoVT family DNA-binding domain-containing protein [Opitutus sp.]
MTTVRTKTFKSGNSEAVRLPKEIAFGEGVELVAVRSGDVLTLYPAKKLTIQEMLAELDKLPAPDDVQERVEVEFLDRPGLYD